MCKMRSPDDFFRTASASTCNCYGNVITETHTYIHVQCICFLKLFSVTTHFSYPNPFTGITSTTTDYCTTLKEDTCRSFYHSVSFTVCVQYSSQSIHIHVFFSITAMVLLSLWFCSQVLIYNLVCMRDWLYLH